MEEDELFNEDVGTSEQELTDDRGDNTEFCDEQGGDFSAITTRSRISKEIKK